LTPENSWRINSIVVPVAQLDRASASGAEGQHSQTKSNQALTKTLPRTGVISGDIDSDLHAVITAWPGLPEHIKKTILILIEKK
jgi:hypothetical protein